MPVLSHADLQKHKSSSESADEHMCVEGSQYRPLPSGQTETAQEAVRDVKAHVLCQMVCAHLQRYSGLHPLNLHHDSRSDSDQMCSMMLKGYTLCLCVVAVLLTAAARSADFEEVEEVAMPLRTFLPRWYKHSCGLNRECLAVHQRQHNPEGAFYAQDEEDEAAEQKYFSTARTLVSLWSWELPMASSSATPSSLRTTEGGG